jgi:retron-type reverse transcriptase
MTDIMLDKMSYDLLLKKEQLDYLIRSAPNRYKVYKIPKKSGAGTRTIAQPAKEVKILQYWVMEKYFLLMPIHQAATAYVKDKNIINNCEPHIKNPYFLKLDFKEFFPSIKGDDFIQYVRKVQNVTFNDIDIQRLVRILFWCPKGQKHLQLSIGAPSSPYLSNAIMYKFDNEINVYCAKHNISYTRYADDMTFSMLDKTMRGDVQKKVIELLKGIPSPRLELNNKKTVFCSKAHRRMITGLIISNDEKISLGRERKRRIRAQLNYAINGKLTPDQKKSLSGMLAFVRNIEPDFISRMENKYGRELITNLK